MTPAASSVAPAVVQARDARVRWGGLLDVAGGGLLLVLVAAIFFGESPPFDLLGAAVGLAGLCAALLCRQLETTALDLPLAIYVSLSSLSVVVHFIRDPPPSVRPGSEPYWQPLLHLLAMALYFRGACWILRTRARLGAVAVAVVFGVTLIAIQATYYHLTLGIGPSRPAEYPIVSQWSGYPAVALLIVIALPICLSVIAMSQSAVTRGAALVIAASMLMYLMPLFSLMGDLAVAATFIVMAAIEILYARTARVASSLLVFAVIVSAFFAGTARLPPLLRSDLLAREVASRTSIWKQATIMVRDHPWIGVGIGRYSAVLERDYTTVVSGADAHAHNMLLHVAVESGVPAAVAFLLIWWRALASGLARSFAARSLDVLAFAFWGALAASFFRAIPDTFLGGLSVSERVGFLTWTLFAALIAADRAQPGPVRERVN